MEVGDSHMVGLNVAMWLHVHAAFSAYAALGMGVLLLSYYLNFSFLYAVIVWALFDVHALTLIGQQFCSYRSEVGLSGLFDKSHDYVCTCLFKCLLLLRLLNIELDLFALGSLLYLPLLLCCFSQQRSEDFRYSSAFAISILNRIFRATVFTLVAVKEEVHSEWSWALVLFPLVVVGMLMTVLLAFGGFLVCHHVRAFRTGRCTRNTLLTSVWHELVGATYAGSLIMWYYGTEAYLEGTGYSPLPFALIAVLNTALCLFTVLNRAGIQ